MPAPKKKPSSSQKRKTPVRSVAGMTRFEMRQQIIEHLKQGYPQWEIAERLSITPKTVSLWVNRYKEAGVEGLKDKAGRGRKPKMGTTVQDKIMQLSQRLSSSGNKVTSRVVAHRLGISHSNVLKVWKAQGFTPSLQKKKHPSSSSSREVSLKKHTASGSKQQPVKGSTAARPQLSDIAARAGVSVATVSRALSNRYGVSKATQQKVKRAVEALGYRPNPLVQALMTSIRGQRKATGYATIAYLEAKMSYEYFGHDLIRQGAQKRAEQRGYQLEIFKMDPNEAIPARYIRMLHARNFNGFLIASMGLYRIPRLRALRNYLQTQHTLSVGWVGQGIPFVVNDQFATAQLAYRNMADLGYKKIGLILDQSVDVFLSRRFSAGFRSAQNDHAAAIEIPLFNKAQVFKKDFVRWYEKYQPDAVICQNLYFKNHLDEMGIKIPEDLGYAYLDVHSSVNNWSGVDQQNEAVGGLAVDQVIALINSNVPYDPAIQTGGVVEGRWVDGATTKKQRK